MKAAAVEPTLPVFHELFRACQPCLPRTLPRLPGTSPDVPCLCALCPRYPLPMSHVYESPVFHELFRACQVPPPDVPCPSSLYPRYPLPMSHVCATCVLGTPSLCPMSVRPMKELCPIAPYLSLFLLPPLLSFPPLPPPPPPPPFPPHLLPPSFPLLPHLLSSPSFLPLLPPLPPSFRFLLTAGVRGGTRSHLPRGARLLPPLSLPPVSYTHLRAHETEADL
eukprot:682108-Rhodomonas_salina.1